VSADRATLTAVAALSDDLRWRMYTFIRRQGRAVTRDEAAASVGISRKLAAFHLDKLVAVGLLRASYKPPGGVRRVGRAPKVYEPTGLELRVSIPHRQWDLIADILTAAVASAHGGGETAYQRALHIADERGRELGRTERGRMRPGRLGAERALTMVQAVLEGHGFDPHRESPLLLRLRNCPFQPLAAKAPDLVCGINRALLAGLLDGLGATMVSATPALTPGACCVELRSPPPPAQ
jgi:predicted ArsR family transcriptional regulator